MKGAYEGDGGPAFPVTLSKAGRYPETFSGMTLRDYFAAAALPSVYAVLDADKTLPDERRTTDTVAMVAYRLADSMLRARSTPAQQKEDEK